MALSLLSTFEAHGNEQALSELKSLISEYNKACVDKDISNLQSLYHPNSYAYETMEKQSDYFDKNDTKVQQQLLSLIGIHEDIATARVKFVVTSSLDRLPKVQTVDTIMVFRKHKEAWLYWDKIYLGFNVEENQANQRVDPTVKTPVESGNEQGTAGHP